VIKNGRAELADFAAVVFNKYALLEFFHTVSSAYVFSAFFVMGISAYHLLKKKNIEFFTKSFKIALVFALICSVLVAVSGDMNGVNVAKVQPAKFAAMESHWETTKNAPIYLFALPDQENEKNKTVIGSIPGMLSFLGFHDFDAEVKGLRDIPKDERPPVFLTFISFRIMVGIGGLLILLSVLGFLKRKKLTDCPLYLKMMILAIPLPLIAIELGWVVAEVGRQPWIVYGLMKTSDAVSPIVTSQVFVSLISFALVYSLLGFVGIYLIAKNAKKGPEGSL